MARLIPQMLQPIIQQAAMTVAQCDADRRCPVAREFDLEMVSDDHPYFLPAHMVLRQKAAELGDGAVDGGGDGGLAKPIKTGGAFGGFGGGLGLGALGGLGLAGAGGWGLGGAGGGAQSG